MIKAYEPRTDSDRAVPAYLTHADTKKSPPPIYDCGTMNTGIGWK